MECVDTSSGPEVGKESHLQALCAIGWGMGTLYRMDSSDGPGSGQIYIISSCSFFL